MERRSLEVALPFLWQRILRRDGSHDATQREVVGQLLRKTEEEEVDQADGNYNSAPRGKGSARWSRHKGGKKWLVT